MADQHQYLLGNFPVWIAGLTQACKKDLEHILELNKKFCKNLQEFYVFPSVNCHVSPSVLQQECGKDDGIPPVHLFSFAISTSDKHIENLQQVKDKAQRLFKHRKDGNVSQHQAQKNKKQAKKYINSAHFQMYGVFHPGLLAIAYTNSSECGDLSAIAKETFATILSRNLLFITGLVLVIRWSIKPPGTMLNTPFGLPPLAKDQLSRQLDESTQPQKIVIYCVHAVIGTTELSPIGKT